jgi:hypothetical protein
MTVSPADSADMLKIGGLTIADELVVLHTYPARNVITALGTSATARRQDSSPTW